MSASDAHLPAEKRVRAAARVTLTVELAVPDAWGPDCQIAQVQKQAKESALGIIERIRQRGHVDYQIVGEPIVRAILIEEER
jgi:hypothetical protein